MRHFFSIKVILEKYLLAQFSVKNLYFWSHLFYAVTIGLVYFQSNIYVIMGLSCAFGILLNVNSTLPYQMISEFHQHEEFRNKSPPGTCRGIGEIKRNLIFNNKYSKFIIWIVGIDCALLSSIYFLAQTLVAIYTSLNVPS